MNENKNPYAFDNIYKINNFMSFKNAMSENSYQNFYYFHSKYQIGCYLIFKFLQIISLYFLLECNIPDPITTKCNHPLTMIISMVFFLFYFGYVVFGERKPTKFFHQFCIFMISMFSHIGYLEYFNNIQLFILFLFIDIYFTSSFTLFNWKYYSCAIIAYFSFFYAFLKFTEQQFQHEIRENLSVIFMIFVLSLIIFGLHELGLRKNWIIYNSFKKSEEFLSNLIENITVPLFVTTPDLTIILMNRVGFSMVIESEIPGDAPLSLDIFLKNILENNEFENLNSMMGVAWNESKVVNKNFMRKKSSNENKRQTILGNIFAITVSQVFFY